MKPETVFFVHAAIIIAAHALDLWTTFAGIHHGARELNPTCETWAHERLLMVTIKAIGVALITGTMWIAFKYHPRAFQPLIFLHHGFMYSVVLGNFWAVRSLKRRPYRHLYRNNNDTFTYVGRCDLEEGETCGPISGVLRAERR